MNKEITPHEVEITPESISRTHTLACLTTNLHDIISEKLDSHSPFVVRIAGFGSLGKTTVANSLAGLFPSATVLGTDGFMPDREERRRRNLTNGDIPAGIDFEGMRNDILQLTSGVAVKNRVYNHYTGKHEVVGLLQPSQLIILDGACALYSDLRLLISSYGIFLNANDDKVRAFLRHQVNTTERGYSEEQSQKALPGYLAGYNEFVLPSRQYADAVCMVDRKRHYQSPVITNCLCST